MRLADTISMNERYWDDLATTYTQQVHDSLACDERGVLRQRLDQFASKRGGAIDFGCGVGHYLAALSQRFRIVHALDHSKGCLERAKTANSELKNIIYRKADLSQPLTDWKPQVFGVCMNVLIAPSHELRSNMLRTMHTAISPGGHLLTLMPALESALYVDTRLVEWNMRDGMTHRRALSSVTKNEADIIGHAAAGIVDRGGEPTKHYLREEAQVALTAAGFEVQDIERVEYSWNEVFHNPPRWMAEPLPWHWLAVCKRT